ncbi:tetratricopeptide repeat protein [Synechococcus sp. Nb3U1]|uniref:tetratricopeptide repeat protein n=1 Tax=Synechococcus sp. Nb3U1 TaxID=1914529 RepID=UPI001F45A5B1|nr:tetratricopeptide repeat-containing glycosyltransferase family protein [Synechococcus sp. Nb3U1]
MPRGFGLGKNVGKSKNQSGGQGSPSAPIPPADALALARQYQESGQLGAALRLCQQVIRAHPDRFEAQALLGSLYLEIGDPRQALTHLQLALHGCGDWIPAWRELGKIWMMLGNLEEAVRAYEQGLAVAPQDGELLSGLGSGLLAQGNLPQAIAVLERAVETQPPPVYALASLGNALLLNGQLPQAETYFRQALALKPAEGRILVNLSHCLHLQDRLEEAADYLKQAIPLLPGDPQPHNNLGTVLQEQNQLQAAIECYRHSLRLAPNLAETHWNLGTALLTLGHYAEGWQEYEWRLRQRGANYPTFAQPLWRGSPLGQRTLLIHAEQGLGDTIQFVRYLPLLAQAHPEAQIRLRCQKSLVELLKSHFQSRHLQVFSEQDPLPPFDCHVPLLSLPQRLGTTLETIPNRIPYLFNLSPGISPVTSWMEEWIEGLPEPSQQIFPKVGLVWASGRRADPELNRIQRLKSCPVEQMLSQLQLPGIRWVSLQVGEDLGKIGSLLEQHRVLEVGSRFRSFVDTAAAVAQLDLVISVDTAVAHLAGAMGKPVWVLLPFAADWRWLLERPDSPWYPNVMRLFRQAAPGDWTGVLEQVRVSLRSWLEGIPVTE